MYVVVASKQGTTARDTGYIQEYATCYNSVNANAILILQMCHFIFMFML